MLMAMAELTIKVCIFHLNFPPLALVYAYIDNIHKGTIWYTEGIAKYLSINQSYLTYMDMLRLYRYHI